MGGAVSVTRRVSKVIRQVLNALALSQLDYCFVIYSYLYQVQLCYILLISLNIIWFDGTPTYLSYVICTFAFLHSYSELGLQQRIDKIDKNRLLKALATNLVIDSLSRAINTSLVGAALFTACRWQVGSFMHTHGELV